MMRIWCSLLSSIERASAYYASQSKSLFEATLPANYPPVSVPSYLAFKLEAVPAGTGLSTGAPIPDAAEPANKSWLGDIYRRITGRTGAGVEGSGSGGK